jgi:nucleoid-associated protein YgaU
MPSSAFRINGFFGDAAQPTGNEISQAAAPAPHIEHQLNSPMDIGRAHQFFQPAQPAQAIGHAAIAAPGAVAAPGLDIASLTAKALSAASQQISPIIQLIMRMPGHIGIMSSVFEAFSNFFMGHADFLAAFDPHLLAIHGADATAHLDASKEVLAGDHIGGEHIAGEHMHFDMHMLPHDAPILGEANFHGMEINSAAGEHSFDLSYVNVHLLDHSNLNVSGTLDGAKSQFEGLSFTDPHGEIISGPSLSQASPATHLASGHRAFLDQSLSRVNSMGTAGSQAIAASTATPSITAALSQPLSTASSSLNVGASAFGQPASALPAVANVNPAAGLGANVSDGGSLSGLSGASDSSAIAAPSHAGASSNLTLALNKAPEGLAKGFGTNEYGANYINEQSSSAGNGLLKGLKAKELSLDDSLKNHKLAQATTPQSPSASHPTANHTNHASDSVKHAAHKASAEPVKHHAVSKHLSSKTPSLSNKGATGSSIAKPTEADAQVPGTEGADGGAQATQSNSEEIADNATDATKASDAPETTSYTVKEGDCLWNIAKDHLGDSSKWQEIYKLNTDQIGDNPDLIHTGATIQLPGGDHALVADAGEGAKYVVKSGDNLWDIAKHNLGEGGKWGDLYKLNHDVIGENPSLIHPGQEFNLGAPHEGVDTGKLADANVPETGATGVAPPEASAPAVDHVAQAPTAPTGPGPSVFGQPSQPTAALPEFGHSNVEVAQHAPVQIQPNQPDPHMFSGGAATAAPAQPMAQPQSVAPSTLSTPTTDAGPGAAGAATLPEFGNGAGPVSPDKSSLVSSSLMSSLQDFITHKK